VYSSVAISGASPGGYRAPRTDGDGVEDAAQGGVRRTGLTRLYADDPRSLPLPGSTDVIRPHHAPSFPLRPGVAHRRLVDHRKMLATRAVNAEASSTASRICPSMLSSWKARVPTNRLMVKPTPVKIDAP
jgi:hypothetical protein